jgi:hypothetical protein
MFVIEYTSCESNFRWMTIEAEDKHEAESLSIEGNDVGGGGITKILAIYEGEKLEEKWDRYIMTDNF